MNEAARSRDADLVLLRIRLVHTFFWVVFAAAILAIPIALAADNLSAALWLSGLVWIECLILLVNRMRCPLTSVAERYADERAVGFDIFLPPWLARNNKLIFGTLFAAVELAVLIRLVA